MPLSTLSLKHLYYLLVPLLILLGLSIIACFFGYAVFLIEGGQWPLSKIIARSTLIFLLLTLFPICKLLAIDKRALGFAEPVQFIRQLMQGMGIGILTLFPVLAVLYWLDVSVVDIYRQWSAYEIFKTLSISLLLGLLIAYTEEAIFRGALVTALAKTTGVSSAVIFSSVYYASLHFLHSKTEITFNDAHWYSGLSLLVEALGNLCSMQVLPAWIALFMVGLFLAVLRCRVRYGIGLSIGCHTAWVWQIKMNKAIFNPDPHAAYAFLVSNYDGVIGPFVALWMMALLLSYRMFSNKPAFSEAYFG